MTELSMYRGDEPSLDITLTSAGVPVNLTGVALRFTAKYHTWDSDDDAVITKTTDDGITVTAPASGVIAVDFLAADTADLVGTVVLVWDVQGVLDGKTKTLARGTLRVSPDVSRTSP